MKDRRQPDQGELFDLGEIDRPQLEAKVEHAIKVLLAYQPKEDYFGCFSGGKDSCVIKELAGMAGVRVAWHYAVTTIDPPELVRFIRRHHPDVKFKRPKHGNFFVRAGKLRGFPTRTQRWCCSEYKEVACEPGGTMILGVRAAESPRRAKLWKELTYHNRSRAHAVSPILNWEDREVWLFIRERKIPYCELYDEGFKRLGCIGCPMLGARAKKIEFARWPKFEAKWRELMRLTWERRTGTKQRDGSTWWGDRFFTNWEEMWEWWLGDRKLRSGDAIDDCEEEGCQLALDMFSEGEDEE